MDSTWYFPVLSYLPFLKSVLEPRSGDDVLVDLTTYAGCGQAFLVCDVVTPHLRSMNLSSVQGGGGKDCVTALEISSGSSLVVDNMQLQADTRLIIGFNAKLVTQTLFQDEVSILLGQGSISATGGASMKGSIIPGTGVFVSTFT
jgi:hypothetical protein